MTQLQQLILISIIIICGVLGGLLLANFLFIDKISPKLDKLPQCDNGTQFGFCQYNHDNHSFKYCNRYRNTTIAINLSECKNVDLKNGIFGLLLS
jgi:hypothetical protein